MHTYSYKCVYKKYKKSLMSKVKKMLILYSLENGLPSSLLLLKRSIDIGKRSFEKKLLHKKALYILGLSQLIIFISITG